MEPRSGTLRNAVKNPRMVVAIGDFGTTGKLQHAVAGAMRDFLQQHRVPLEAMLLLGDNFYGPVEGGFTVDSPRWRTTFHDVYPERVFGCPCHAVLDQTRTSRWICTKRYACHFWFLFTTAGNLPCLNAEIHEMVVTFGPLHGLGDHRRQRSSMDHGPVLRPRR